MYHSNHPSPKEATKFVKTDGLQITIISFPLNGKTPNVKRYDLNFSNEIPLFPLYPIMPTKYYEKYVEAERQISLSKELFEA